MKNEIKLDLTAFDDFAKVMKHVGIAMSTFTFPTIKPRSFSSKRPAGARWTFPSGIVDEIADPENFMVIKLGPSPLSDRRLELPSAFINISASAADTLYALNVITIKDGQWLQTGIFNYELTAFGKRCKLIIQHGHFTEIWIPIEVL